MAPTDADVVELKPLHARFTAPAGAAADWLRARVDEITDAAGALRLILRGNTLALLMFGCICVRLCAPDAAHLSWDFTTIEVVFGVLFPLTYAIGQSFGRRERVLDILGSMKSSAVQLYLLHRDYDAAVALPGRGGVSARNVRKVLIEYATCLQKYVEVHDDSSIPSWEEPGAASVLGRALTCLSTLSVLNEQLVFRQNYANGGMGRANEYLRQITTNFEQICSIKRYQSTPRRLGALTFVMVHIAPALLAPYWRHFCSDFDHGKGISPKGVCVPAYLACTLFCVILSTMYSVALDIADPWDGVGADDIHLVLDREIAEATAAEPLPLSGPDGEVQVSWDWAEPLPASHDGSFAGGDSSVLGERRRSWAGSNAALAAAAGADGRAHPL